MTGRDLSLHCHHQNDSRIKMGSNERHFNVSVGSDGRSHRTVRDRVTPPCGFGLSLALERKGGGTQGP